MTSTHSSPDAAPDRWVEIAVRVPEPDVELIADVLREYAPDGVAILPVIRIDEGGEFAYEELPEPATVSAAVPGPFGAEERARLEARLAALPLSAPAGPVAYRDVGTHDWAEEWKRFYTLQRIGARLVVHPTWEPYTAAPGEAVVALDPGAAFGTGQHETTRLCLAALEREVRDGDEILDVGCGSGVLSVAAAKLGFGPVTAVDMDAVAVEATTTNAAANDVEIVVRRADALAEPLPPVDVAVANVTLEAVTALAPRLKAQLLVASGYLERDEPLLVGWHRIDRCTADGWAADLLRRV